MDAARIQERREAGTRCWEGHGCERGGNSEAALVLLNSCSQGTPLLAGVPQVSGFSKQQLMSRDPASKGQVQGCTAGLERHRGGTSGTPPARDGAEGGREELWMKS